MRILFDSRKEKYKSPFGCIRRGEKCVLSIDIPQSCKTSSVRLCIFDEIGFRMLMPFYKVGCSEGYEFYKTEFALFHTGLYFYYFKIETEESNFSLYKQGSDTNIEAGDLWQITCYDENYDTPEEFKGRVMYQIFPDRFSIGKRCSLAGKLEPFTLHDNTNDIPRFLPDENGRILNNDFYGGNLDGIRLRLPYIKE
ncbi:MAG: hypothetical protein Q8873_01050, partial [Bacillota bacterium]|nr:hypothetical protein [Bacillota bacterium]